MISYRTQYQKPEAIRTTSINFNFEFMFMLYSKQQAPVQWQRNTNEFDYNHLVTNYLKI